jgi:4-hydroxybenzoate polyprenyltransferase
LIWVRELRVHQWVKNLLLFVPALTSFRFLESAIWGSLLIAFAAFSIIASAIYIINDLVDAPNDRAHLTKRNRPIASGSISSALGLWVALALVLAGLGLGFFAGLDFLLVLALYLAATFAYTFWLKKTVLVDCLTLAGLYTIRVIAGAVVTGIALSFWLLAFSIFFFASLAWVKRYAELEVLGASGKSKADGRGYSVTDQPLILAFGTMSAFIAVLIFALYLDSDAIKALYSVPEIGWLAIPLMMYLIGRIWLKAHRGQMLEDPILFVLRDFASLLTLALIAGSLALAHFGWVW